MDVATVEDINAVVEPLLAAVRDELMSEGFAEDKMRFEVFVDMRFVGQAFELTTPMPTPLQATLDLVSAFRQVYEERYAHADQGEIEAVSFRVAGYGLGEKPRVPVSDKTGSLEQAKRGSRTVYLGGSLVTTPIYDRDAIPSNTTLSGPAHYSGSGFGDGGGPGLLCHKRRERRH